MNIDSFNIFEFLAIDKKETIHSQFIASLLNLNTIYFKSFLKHIECDGFFNDSEDHEIITEKNLGENYGRADIWIGRDHKLPGKRKRVIIENKLSAADQQGQLRRYRKYLDSSNRQGRLFYLTLQYKDASINSATQQEDIHRIMNSRNSDRGYKKISYYEHILPWLEEIKANEKKNGSPDLAKIIDQYSSTLKKMTRVQEWLQSDKDIPATNETEYRIALEHHFWSCLHNKIESTTSPEFEAHTIDSRRKYSFDKISKKHRNRNFGRDYGLISGNCRIQITYAKPDSVILTCGRFERDRWIKEKEIGPIINLNDFRNKHSMEKAVEDVFEKYNELKT